MSKCILILESPFEDSSDYMGKFKSIEDAKEESMAYVDESEFIKWSEFDNDGDKELHGKKFWNAEDKGDDMRDWYRIVIT